MRGGSADPTSTAHTRSTRRRRRVSEIRSQRSPRTARHRSRLHSHPLPLGLACAVRAPWPPWALAPRRHLYFLPAIITRSANIPRSRHSLVGGNGKGGGGGGGGGGGAGGRGMSPGAVTHQIGAQTHKLSIPNMAMRVTFKDTQAAQPGLIVGAGNRATHLDMPVPRAATMKSDADTTRNKTPGPHPSG